MLAYRLADRLHKSPSEVLQWTPEEAITFLAYLRLTEAK